MLHFLLSIRYTDESVGTCTGELQDGQFCCFGEVCDYKCVYDNESVKIKSHCFHKTEEVFCQTSILGVFISILIAITPTILFLGIGVLRKYQNYYALFMSLLLNVFWAMLIMSMSCSVRSGLWTKHIAFWYILGMLGLAASITLYFLNLCNRNGATFLAESQSSVINETDDEVNKRLCCPKLPELDAGSTYRELNYPLVEFDELISAIEENVSAPPEPKMHWMVSYKNPGESKEHRIHDSSNIEYGSWQSYGETTPYSQNMITVYRCDITYTFDSVLEDEIKQFAEVNRLKHQGEGQYESWITNYPKNLMRYAISGNGSKFFRYFTSGFNKKLYAVLAVFGYHYIMDAIWIPKVQYIRSVLTKKMYKGLEGRAKRGENDTDVFAEVHMEAPSMTSNLV
ncbi:hypothetical protein TVAG_252900 [Trichomonas vaginalis G3]|uniref:Uncharacterized protein n=1 Tax=Trichomonas vaginalis (strain ATCC PRA-98 / G3) TaxID=412133 RepID=A2EXE9_TRIV3|nr:hypothetical protein TVAGG3_0193390 [Trichomonas vaginalis G3]EAY02639.1 hypothetical protein TVAG_252900 [Trichomonas vaginalis G3]KAI5550136.1 hypothetical protein TVAGG3_0193390 [Trichomonas vaginalis G3]|eukprot:XP_001314862.1 hypothetical protein [Trichomonas vaginalis G3]